MWEYSNEAVNLIKRFKEKFPEVVDALEKNPDGKNYSLEEIMPDVDDRTARLQMLIEWLAEVDLQAGGMLPTSHDPGFALPSNLLHPRLRHLQPGFR
jgi:hypothetical protein